jgi:hypothetical protein
MAQSPPLLSLAHEQLWFIDGVLGRGLPNGKDGK